MKKAMLLTVGLCLALGSACSLDSPNDETQATSEQALTPGDYTVAWADYACRVAQVSAIRFRAVKQEWVKQGVSQADVDDVARIHDALAGDRTNGIEGLCYTTAGFARFDVQGALSVAPMTNTWTRTLDAKLKSVGASLGQKRGITSEAALTLLSLSAARAVAARGDNFPALAYYAPRVQFDAALKAIRTKLALNPASSAIRSLSLADSVGVTCTNKRKTLDATENGKRTLTYETTYSDGSVLIQEQRYDQSGRVYYVKTIHDPGHGQTPTSVALDGTKDLSGRSEYWEQQANYAALTAGTLGTLGGVALAVPEPIASKATAGALGLFASGFLAEAALFKMLGAYYGRPNYFPDTLDQTPCASSADAGAPPAPADAGTRNTDAPACTSAQAKKTSATWDKCLTKYGKAWVFGNGSCPYWSLPQGVECRAECQSTCGTTIPQCVQVHSAGGWTAGSKECVTL